MESILAHFRKELLIACHLSARASSNQLQPPRTLLPSEQADEQDASPVHSEQRANRIELGGEDLQNNERKGKLSDSGADVGSFEGSLRCANLHHLSWREND